MSASSESFDYEAWRQKQEQEREARGLKRAGPCLICDQEFNYGHDHYGLYERGGKNWLDKQFAPQNREAHVEAIREGLRFDRTRKCVFLQFVCPICSVEVQLRWPEKDKLRRLKWEQEQIQREKAAAEYKFDNTWRKPDPGEFEIVSGRREFQVRSLDRRPIKLVFRWRTCVSQECCGRITAQSVGLWASGRLTAHYYGWQLPGCRGDIFGPGLAFWLEKTFQRDLTKISPTATWRAKGRPVGMRTDDGWDGLDSLHICNYGQGKEWPPPCLIHTVWPNGSIYAQLRNFHLLQEVVEFAWESLHVDIREH